MPDSPNGRTDDADDRSAVRVGPYRSWTAIAQALKAAAVRTARSSGMGEVNTQLRQAQFDRFLCRVFADRDRSEWLLKGGTGMLARVPTTRATKDIDLAATGSADLDAAVLALQTAAARDLDDHVRFTLTRTIPTGLGDTQPGVRTRRLVFTCTDAETNKNLGEIPIDLVVGPAPVGRVDTADPAHRLVLPRPLRTSPYRLFPVADQIAEKVCTTMYTNYPGGRRSSRVKDLLDLVVITRTQHVDLRELQQAIDTKRATSGVERFSVFTIPNGWHRPYRALATKTPAVEGVVDAQQAAELVANFLSPALARAPAPTDTTWTPGHGWIP